VRERIPVSLRMEEVKALADEVRVLILDLLSEKPHSIQEIAEEKGLPQEH